MKFFRKGERFIYKDILIYKMRDEKRINKILGKIKKYWERNPDMRFNQLLINLGVIPDGRHWNMEDDLVEELLDKNINGL